MKRYWTRYTVPVGIVALLLVLLLIAVSIPKPVAHAQAGDWPTFLGNVEHSGFNSAETIINRTTAPGLTKHWSHKVKGKISTQPIEANGMVYWGSYDGVEHASRLSDGTDVWTASLGQTTNCKRTVLGVLSSATVASVLIGGVTTPVVYVAGGDSSLYALDATLGTVLWHTPLGSPPSSFLYSSPTFFNGYVYIGVSGNADCSRVQGQIVQLDASTGIVANTFNVVPTGCIGGSVWTSPTIDEATGMLYFSSSEKTQCSQPEPMTTALIELQASDLSLVGFWSVPASQRITDDDFGSSPTLFQATISGVSHQMVGLVAKSGIYYAFDRTNISAGPLWQIRLATAPGPSQSSSAWDGSFLYVAAGNSTINGVSCPGSLSALDPSNGHPVWQDCLNFDAFGGVISVPGLVELGVGNTLMIFDATNGNVLFSFQDTTNTKSNFLGPGSISNGVLYHANMDGNLYAFGP